MEFTACDEQFYEWLEQLQTVDFALIELNLFLDTHPEDLKSIQQYNQLSQERMRLAHQFQEVYGPLMNFGHAFSRFPWQWSQSPWPWQV
ncbi:spore coat protein CotJB [Paenibacillus glacialis]|uniref:CotJB protein n=1 Tax=Paenibacillus glacialis TaxID=494026 RepID=A0A168LDF9_9BACL|nr:spore coat protein CotJB [Paenibacillus glacialis]OAB43232.1 cotJB protein [Paenibacillus glacialis]